MRVLVDAGHGGSDHGAERGELRESQITLKIALRLAELLRADPRFNVQMTRDDDRTVSLAERAKLARSFKADALVSIHANSNSDARVTGVEVYFQNQLPADEESMFLAAKENGEVVDPRDAIAEGVSVRGDLANILDDLRRSRSVRASFDLSRFILAEWPQSTERHSTRAIRQAPFYLVSRGATPAVLVEVGFLSHPAQGRKLAEHEHQVAIAQRLAHALARFKETVDNDHGRNLKSPDAF